MLPQGHVANIASVSEKEENHGSGPPKCGNHQVIPFIWCWVSLQKPSSKTLHLPASVASIQKGTVYLTCSTMYCVSLQ